MEVIGVVASIGGIIQLALHGVALIKHLREVFSKYDSEAADVFFDGLINSARLLHDVQALCKRIERHPNPNISKIRTATLQLHLEDCVKDLELWKKLSERVQRPRWPRRKKNH